MNTNANRRLPSLVVEPSALTRSACETAKHDCGTVLEIDIDRNGHTIERCPRTLCRDTWRRVTPIVRPSRFVAEPRAAFRTQEASILDALPMERGEAMNSTEVALASGVAKHRVCCALVNLVKRKHSGVRRVNVASPGAPARYAYWRVELQPEAPKERRRQGRSLARLFLGKALSVERRVG